MQKHDFAFTLSCGDLIVLRTRQTFSQLCQLVIVRRKQSLRRVFGRVMQILRN